MHNTSTSKKQSTGTTTPSRKTARAAKRKQKEAKPASARKPQNRKIRPPAVRQELPAVINYHHKQWCGGLLHNCSGLRSTKIGSSYGVSADVIAAADAAIRLLRLICKKRCPKWLTELAARSVLSQPDLIESYPPSHPIWTLDLQDLLRLGPKLSAADPLVWDAIRAFVNRNFTVVQSNHLNGKTSKAEGKKDRIKSAINRMEMNYEDWCSSSEEIKSGLTKGPGWSEATEKNSKKDHRVCFRLEQVMPHTCVKGGNRVKM